MGHTIPPQAVIDYPAHMLMSFVVYCYDWIDNLHFALSPKSFVSDPTEYVMVVQQRFREAGWNGDGEIGLIWLPPFVFPLNCRVSSVGIAIWHVKQEEDGTSWLLSPIDLPFEEFFA